jgi:hypothetical protein
MKDQKLIDKKTAELKIGEEKKAEQEGKKNNDETDLSAVQAEQDRLNSLVEIRNALDARVQELRATCLEIEGTTALRRLQSKHQNNERMHESLKNCRQDVATAATMFKKALGIQAKAARSNAMAAGANIGQAIGGGGGRGIGNSPGERLMQIRRNQATKQSIEIAKEAAGKLNLAQDRLSNDLRVNFPEEMKGVGIIDVPDLWTSVSSWWWKESLSWKYQYLCHSPSLFPFTELLSRLSCRSSRRKYWRRDQSGPCHEKNQKEYGGAREGYRSLYQTRNPVALCGHEAIRYNCHLERRSAHRRKAHSIWRHRGRQNCTSCHWGLS